jgi:hypothetical protein
LEAIRRVFRQCDLHDRAQSFIANRGEIGMLIQLFEKYFHHRIAREWRLAGQHEIHAAAQGVNVAARADLAVTALLGTNVFGRSDNFISLGNSLIVYAEQLGDAEVEDAELSNALP